jgi:energy-coupling factor transporter ATP-binding protein EcfA2
VSIKSIQFSDLGKLPWEFSKFQFKSINLLVGATGSGKTRFINTIFNISRMASGALSFSNASKWVIELEIDKQAIRWEFENEVAPFAKQATVVKETISDVSPDKVTPIVERTSDSFVFDGQKLPKLSREQSAISLLRGEEKIRPIFDLLSHVIKRSFSESSLGQLVAYRTLSRTFRDTLKAGKMPEEAAQDLGASAKLLILKQCFKSKYEELIRAYKSVFPFIEACEVSDAANFGLEIPILGETPVFAIKERKVNSFIPLHELSSGMQKVLLLMTDIMCLQPGHIYIVDEYENSLGVNAIDFLPAFLVDNLGGNQFVITTHHPYLINSIPVKDWSVFHRNGSKVNITDGATLVDKYGKSKQQAFIQLINDPLYTSFNS